MRGTLSKRWHAWLMARASRYADAYLRPYKEQLFAGLHGRVLEIGPGTGPNLRYYPSQMQWIGVEPNPFMHRYLRIEAERWGVDAKFINGRAERLDLDDASVDAVISTHVLCSVSDPERALREILRVLVPGGRFLFIEHVAAPAGTRLRYWQERLRPLWRRLADGCHPDRETDQLIQAAGFERVFMHRLSFPFPVVAPHIIGTAIKSAAS
ncbi:MAG: class I SAM-dependent methyltransferase [Blastocatellia bacterium]|nr:class I SAM-dependent methyltransferase [Blastocatellia bacterium]MCS7156914.1 class I SAM-dependent methyltransferase [Blastocatellia bacterium]MCX7752113.1 class I SAM-dependent methyltransferase [Blastocatellia bacterium]MDW8167606.1 class I SAM-dependent methyltransferase [Acidobacteriota bacterium]MDW8256206.1 class I SAM-dependent methyltransferase [Acidobacteriota bacterium]